MANNVSFGISFYEINDAAKAKWKEMTDRMEGDDSGEMWFGDMWVDGKEGSPTKEDVRQYSWTTENIGPKWCYVNDVEETGCYGYSAWSWPEDGLNWILEQLTEVDPNLVTAIHYDDEMPNFYGVYVYEGTELYDGFEDEDDELRDRIFHEYPHLKEHWDSENDEWQCDEDGEMTEAAYEAEDEYRDLMYDVMNNAQDELVTDSLKQIEENRKEPTVGC